MRHVLCLPRRVRCELTVTSFSYFLCCLLSFYVTIESTVFYTNKFNRNCLLFAKIFEHKRILIPGPVGICEMFLILQCLFSLLGFMFFRYSLPWRNSGRFKYLSVAVLVAKIINVSLFAAGFKSTCDSLNPVYSPVCSTEVFNNLDWKYFTPKYVSAYKLVGHYWRMLTALCVSVLFWCIATLQHGTYFGNQPFTVMLARFVWRRVSSVDGRYSLYE